MSFPMDAFESAPRLMCEALFKRFKKAGLADEPTPLKFLARLMGLIDIERTTNFSSGVPMSVKYDFSMTLECLQYLYVGKYHPYIMTNFLGYFDELSRIKPSKRLDRATRCVVDVLKAYKLEQLFIYFAPLPTMCVDMAYHLYKDNYREVLDNFRQQFTDASE